MLLDCIGLGDIKVFHPHKSVGTIARSKGFWLDLGFQATHPSDISNCLLCDRLRGMCGVLVDIQVDFHFPTSDRLG